MFIWPLTQEQFPTYDYLRRSISRRYKIPSHEIYIQVMLNGIRPLCKCGCGEEPNWRNNKFQKYIMGHNNAVANPMQGKNHSLEAKESISRKRKEKFANGTYDIWQHRDTPETRAALLRIGESSRNNLERAKKISLAHTGKKHSVEHRKNVDAAIKKAWENPELRERQSHNRMRIITDNGWQIRSKLEDKFEVILQSANIKYHTQHYVRELKALYDFYIHTNTGGFFLVEVHGNYWHCKVGSKFEIPAYAAQKKNIINDVRKAQWCADNNITLVVIWEDELDSALDIILPLL